MIRDEGRLIVSGTLFGLRAIHALIKTAIFLKGCLSLALKLGTARLVPTIGLNIRM